MIGNPAIHIIEQFAAQAPFAIWITDSRGVSIFANKKLHEMLEIPEYPAMTLGLNLFENPALKDLGLEEAALRAKEGEALDQTVKIESPDRLMTQFHIHRKKPLILRIKSYALRSADQKIEHHVIVLIDISEAFEQREKTQQHLRDLTIFNKSKWARLARLTELREEAAGLEAEIRKLGGTPVSGE